MKTLKSHWPCLAAWAILLLLLALLWQWVQPVRG